MKNNLNKILIDLEKIHEDQLGQLQGGFVSVNIQGLSPRDQANGAVPNNCFQCHSGNNCLGKNCAEGCGKSFS